MHRFKKNRRKLIQKLQYLNEINFKLQRVKNEVKMAELKKRKESIEKEIENIRNKDQNYIQNFPQYVLQGLIHESKENGFLTYDDLYDIIPDDIVTADMIDAIVKLLEENDVKVIDKEEITAQSLDNVNEEYSQMERDIQDQLDQLLKGSYKIEQNDEYFHKHIINDISEKVDSKLSDIHIKTPTIHLPQLSEVSPKLTQQDESLLISKSKLKKNGYTPLSQRDTNKGNILENIMPSTEDKNILHQQTKKIYSATRIDNDRRLSMFAKVVGDRAEEIVVKFLSETISKDEKNSIRWVSKAGETPGWDIEYFNMDNQLVAIEVKGTNGDSFPNIEITANEWNAANELLDHYWIYLVTSCFGTNPQIQRLQNPANLKNSGKLRVTPIIWRVEMIR